MSVSVITVRRLKDISLPDLGRQLRGVGVRLRVSPFVVTIRSDIPVVAEGLSVLYANHEVLPVAEGFSDFHVAVISRRGWGRSKCVFQMDGVEPFTPLAINEAFAFLEWGLNWCVTSQCHQWITLHAAVLERGGRAVLLPAPPGSGKSTFCAALMMDGWRLLSDEMVLLDPKTLLVTPSVRPISLKNRSIDLMKERAPYGRFGPVARDTLKGTVCHLAISDESLEKADTPATPAWIVFPRYQRDAGLSVEPRGRASALAELFSNCFNHQVHGREGFRAMVRLMAQVKAFDLVYDDLEAALSWMAAQVDAA